MSESGQILSERKVMIAGQEDISLSCVECFKGTLIGTDSSTGVVTDKTGLMIWPASYALCQYLVKHRHDLDDRHILELGAGAGLVGLVAGRLSSSNHVTLTDGDLHALDLIKTNINRNFEHQDDTNADSPAQQQQYGNQKKKMAVAQLAWGDEEDAEEIVTSRGLADIIIGSDVLYPAISKTQVANMLRSARRLLKGSSNIHEDPPLQTSSSSSSSSAPNGRLILSFIARDGKRTLRNLLLACREEGFILEHVIRQEELKDMDRGTGEMDVAAVEDNRVEMGAQILILTPSSSATIGHDEQEAKEQKLLPEIWARDPTPEPTEEWVCPFGGEEEDDDDDEVDVDANGR